MTATAQLEELRREVAKQRTHAREAELQVANAQRAHESARERLIGAHAVDDPQEVKQATAALTKAQQGVEEAELKWQAARLRLERAERDASVFRQENSSELISELEAADDEATGSMRKALDLLVAGDRQWRAVGAQATELVKAAGGDPQRDVHDRHGYETLVRDARRAQQTEPRSALPHWRYRRVLDEQERRNLEIRRQRESREATAQALSTGVFGGDEAA